MKEKLEPYPWNLEGAFNSIYDVPVYQRPYSWDKDEVNTLLYDIFGAYDEDKEKDYFTGNIIIHDKEERKCGNINCFEIVDGQQRITTFTLLLLAIYVLAKERRVSQSDLTLSEVQKALWKYVNREFRKDLRTVTLNSIEKTCFIELYDLCFDRPQKVIEHCDKFSPKSQFEKRVIENFKRIYNALKDKFPAEQKEELLDFADYILKHIIFIAITTTYSPSKVFSMFESINSKGKKLEEIDLIKTYIFSKLDEKDYDEYLDKWGKLIINTKDNLYDYLYNYIKAFLSFYRQNITILNFKYICKQDLCRYFKTNNEADALKLLLNDLLDKVDYYNMLDSFKDACKFVKDNEFKFFYKIFTDISYKHPKPLFLRTFIEFGEGKIAKKDVVAIVVETIKFMMKFLTISGRDSKDAISLFSGIMNEIYQTGEVTKDVVVNFIAAKLIEQGISDDKLKSDIKAIDAYEKKDLSKPLLALYEAYEKDDNGHVSISYDKAFTLLNSYGDTFSLDHLLVQTPAPDSEFKYYNNQNKLVLKEGHDFPSELVVDGMDYDLFTSFILNKIGNLRLYYLDKNSSRKNSALQLKEYPNFNTYADIQKRNNEVVDAVIDYCLPNPKTDIKTLQNSYKMFESALPKMDKLIEFGLVQPGDKLYITKDPENSVATLLDDKYVEFNGQKMTLNEWGCAVTGWLSIRIYAYTAKVGEKETLHEKRLKFIRNQDDEEE